MHIPWKKVSVSHKRGFQVSEIDDIGVVEDKIPKEEKVTATKLVMPGLQESSTLKILMVAIHALEKSCLSQKNPAKAVHVIDVE